MANTAELTLTDFLLARIAEDEADARAAIERMDVGDGWSVARWEWHAAGQHESQPRPTNYAIIEGAPTPARVLAECAAKRQAVELRDELDQMARATSLSEPEQARDSRNTRLGLDLALRALATPFADHPDYRAEWRI